MREQEGRSAPSARTLRANLKQAELILWSQLNKRAQRSVRFRRQTPIGPYVADFACVAARLIVELDGATHGSTRAIVHDEKRTSYLQGLGWMVMRFTNDDIDRRLGQVLDAIWNGVDQRAGC